MQEAKEPNPVNLPVRFGATSDDFLSFEARFLSLSDFSLNFDNYFLWKLNLGAIFSEEDTMAMVSPARAVAMSTAFRDIFTEVPYLPNFEDYSTPEKERMVLFWATRKLFQWVFWLLTDRQSPVTINCIIFILEVARKLPDSDRLTAEISALIASLSRGGEISRKEIFLALSGGVYPEWFPTFWAGKFKEIVDKDPDWACQPIPLTWSLIETNGLEWLSCFATLKLWAKGLPS